MAIDLEHGDVVASVASGSKDGDDRIIYRYADGTTKTLDHGEVVETGVASDTATWWR